MLVQQLHLQLQREHGMKNWTRGLGVQATVPGLNLSDVLLSAARGTNVVRPAPSGDAGGQQLELELVKMDADGPLRRKAVLWDAVEQRKARETAEWGPPDAAAALYYAATLADAEAALRTDEVLASAEREIAKDIKRTFPWMKSYAAREAATRNVLLTYSYRNPEVGYCQSLNFICGALLMAPLPEADAFFSLCTVVEDLMPPDYYTRENDILGARVDQLVYSTLLGSRLPRLAGHLLDLGCPISLFSIQWFMCLFVDTLPAETLFRVWDLLVVYGPVVLVRVGARLVVRVLARVVRGAGVAVVEVSFRLLLGL